MTRVLLRKVCPLPWSTVVAGWLLVGGATNAAFGGSLAGPYTDPHYQTEIGFGAFSHYIQPWRGYLETVPAHLAVQPLPGPHPQRFYLLRIGP